MPKAPKQISSLKAQISRLTTKLRAAEAKFKKRMDKAKSVNARKAEKVALRSRLKKLSKAA